MAPDLDIITSVATNNAKKTTINDPYTFSIVASVAVVVLMNVDVTIKGAGIEVVVEVVLEATVTVP
jgi:hypothetical protein